MERMDQDFATIQEKFDNKFRTNDQLKVDIQKQMSTVVTTAVNDVRDAFLEMNESNKKAMEKLSVEIEAKGFVGDDEDRLELQKLRDKTVYQYMDTLINTARIELGAQIKQAKMAGGDSNDGLLMQTIA